MTMLSPEAMTSAFMKWFEENDLDGQLTDSQVRLLADSFYAGAFYIVKASL